MTPTTKDIELLNSLYEGRKAYHGELHDHAKTGGTSDGKRPLSHWLGAMEALELDFAAILDHRQVRHMYEPEWQDGTFIGGSEPGTRILDIDAENNGLHYNMIFEGPAPLEELLDRFPEFEFEGGREGHFKYPKFTRERFCELVDTVMELGGFFVHPHPKQVMVSDDPLNYLFRERTGIEVFYISADSEETRANYELYVELLALGKQVFSCAGGDEHSCCHDKAITTIYAAEKKNSAYIDRLRHGDFVCGGVGIKMCIGDTLMGGECDFSGKRAVISVGDFHKRYANSEHNFRLDVISDKGVIASREFSSDEEIFVALDVPTECQFIRTEVFDVNKELRIALGNPIWNKK